MKKLKRLVIKSLSAIGLLSAVRGFYHQWVSRPDEVERQRFPQRVQFYRSFINPGDLCFDIGANVGNRVQVFLEIGARVVAVEPQEDCVTELSRKFGDRITIIRKAIGASAGRARMLISDASVLSTLSRDWVEKSSNTRFKDHIWHKEVDVEVVTADQLISEYGLPAFVKIDVEGFELEVLNGLSGKPRVISFEYNVPELTANALNCVKRLAVLGDYQFNYSAGETMELALKKWVTNVEMEQIISSKDFLRNNFGDIYAKLTTE